MRDRCFPFFKDPLLAPPRRMLLAALLSSASMDVVASTLATPGPSPWRLDQLQLNLRSTLSTHTSPELIGRPEQERAELRKYFLANGTTWAITECAKENISSLHQSVLCPLLNRSTPAPSQQGPRRTPRARVRKHIEKKEWSQLANLSISELHQGMKSVSDKRFKASLSDLLAKSQESCVASSAVYTIFAARVEHDLPSEDAFSQIFQLHEKNQSCFTDTESYLARYRHGLLRILQGECVKAMQPLKEVLGNAQVDYLHTRAFHWLSYCQKELGPQAATTNLVGVSKAEMQRRFPLSYHSFFADPEDLKALITQVKNNPEPELQRRSSLPKAELANALTFWFEHSLTENNGKLPPGLLRGISPDQFRELEPRFRLYLAVLAHHLQEGLFSFRLLAGVIADAPELQSATAMRLFYPLWQLDLVKTHASALGLDPLLMMALIRQESAFDERARSPVGARGLMQLMPASARSIDRKVRANDLYKPEVNVRVGARYLHRLMQRYNNNLAHVLAGYNAGSGQIANWQKRYLTADPLLFKDLMPFRETREYVASILRNLAWYQALAEIEQPATSTTVATEDPSQTGL